MNKPNAETIFHEARKLPQPDQAAYLRSACATDDALLTQVEELLGADLDAGSFMQTLTAEQTGTDRSVGDGTHQPGDVIGRYKLLQVIGEGGFGEVWMADQREPVKRRVAVKVIKLGMDTKQVIARFEAERQALAMMDHPNIAKVLDAGATDGGRPYFVMEYIRGVPLLEYCDTERLDTRARLELFRTVCHAIQHAHQKGVIHRDIKPSNVLVTLHDGEPVPKVIDFGIAKATNQELTEKTLFTRHRQMIGTPAYMSPEQAEMSGLDIDTRSDIYALGVLLYELLTGTTPLSNDELMSQGFAEMMRMIKEVEPQRPSTRLSTHGATDTHSGPRRQAATADQLSSQLKGDLDWIVMMCLEKDRTRRYASATGLSEDIKRYLCDEPVSASPPSATYRLRKLVKRNKSACVAAAVVLLALVLGVIGTSVGLTTAIAAQEREAEQRNIVEQRFESALRYVHTVLGDVLPQVRPLVGATAAYGELTSATTEFLASLSVGEDDSQELRWLTASMVGDLAASQGNPYGSVGQGDYEKSLASSQRALELLLTLEPTYPSVLARGRLEFTLRDKIATAEALTGDAEAALQTYLRMETDLNNVITAARENPEVSAAGTALLAGALSQLNMRIGNIQMQLGALDAAHERYARTCAPAIKRRPDLTMLNEEQVHNFSVCLDNLTTVLARLERHDDSVPYAEQNLEVVRFKTDRWPANPRFERDEVDALGTLAIQYALVQRFCEAETLIDEGLPLAEALVGADSLNRSRLASAVQSTAAFGHALLLAAQSEDFDTSETRRLAQRALDVLGRARQQLEVSGGLSRAETFFYDLPPGKLEGLLATARAVLDAVSRANT